MPFNWISFLADLLFIWRRRGHNCSDWDHHWEGRG